MALNGGNLQVRQRAGHARNHHSERGDDAPGKMDASEQFDRERHARIGEESHCRAPNPQGVQGILPPGT